jgi:hypothetical protein
MIGQRGVSIEFERIKIVFRRLRDYAFHSEDNE